MKNNNNTQTSNPTAIYVIIGLIIIAIAFYFIHKKRKLNNPEVSLPDPVMITDSINKQLKDYYSSYMNKWNQMYNFMYSLSLPYDDTIPEPVIQTNPRKWGIPYEDRVNFAYEYIAKLANTEDKDKWSLNLSNIYSVLEKFAEIEVANKVISDFATQLKTKDLKELEEKVKTLSEEVESYQELKNVIS